MINAQNSSQDLDLNRIQNLAITGVNGFVGKSIVEFISTLPEKNLPNRLTLITRSGINFDLSENLRKRTIEVKQDLTYPWKFTRDVSHLIGLAADGSKDPYSQEACTNYEEISKNLVDWVGSNKANIRILHASSGACFGYKPIDTTQSADSKKDCFIRNRLSVENYLIEKSRDLEFELSIARLFTFSGTNILEKRQYAISQFIISSIKSGQINVLGDPLTQRSYLHQADMSEWMLRALIAPEQNSLFQIGSDKSVTIVELAEFISEKTGAKVNYSANPSGGDVYIPQNIETRIKLGVDERTGWKDAVIEMIAKARTLTNGAR